MLFRSLALSESASGQIDLPDDFVVYREYDALKKASGNGLEPVRGKWPVCLEGETKIRELNVTFTVAAVDNRWPRLASAATGHGEESFDADALGAGLFIRTWQEGDRFQPLGMSESKKLQDFFVDEKVPRHQRGRVPLLCAADGRIAWVVGHRIAEPFKVTEQARRVLRVRFQG